MFYPMLSSLSAVFSIDASLPSSTNASPAGTATSAQTAKPFAAGACAAL